MHWLVLFAKEFTSIVCFASSTWHSAHHLAARHQLKKKLKDLRAQAVFVHSCADCVETASRPLISSNRCPVVCVQIELLAQAESSRRADARRAALHKRCLEESVEQLRVLQIRCSRAEAKVQRDKEQFDAAMKRAEVRGVCVPVCVPVVKTPCVG